VGESGDEFGDRWNFFELTMAVGASVGVYTQTCSRVLSNLMRDPGVVGDGFCLGDGDDDDGWDFKADRRIITLGCCFKAKLAILSVIALASRAFEVKDWLKLPFG
jgi:hypothetical protein